MTPEQTKTLYGLMCATWRNAPNEPELAAWTLAFEDADPHLVMLVAKQIIREDRPFMPRPGEILAELRKHDETIPPTLDEATGYYLSGNWDVHPLVDKAARAVEWDRNHPEVAVQAKFDFRQNYEAALATLGAEVRREERQALHGSGEFLEGLMRPDDEDDGSAGALVPR